MDKQAGQNIYNKIWPQRLSSHKHDFAKCKSSLHSVQYFFFIIFASYPRLLSLSPTPGCLDWRVRSNEKSTKNGPFPKLIFLHQWSLLGWTRMIKAFIGISGPHRGLGVGTILVQSNNDHWLQKINFGKGQFFCVFFHLIWLWSPFFLLIRIFWSDGGHFLWLR